MIRTMAELNPPLAMMLFGDIEVPEIDYHGPNVILNKEKRFGAIAIIFAHDRLMEIYPTGYVVLPSSIHEVIVMPYDENEALSNMVNEISAEEISPEDVLGYKAYLFKGKGVE